MVKQLARLIIIISLFIVNNAQCQNTIKDTIGFKKDFEELLIKYGIKNKGYLINVMSVNQKGGQTALIINNNYYTDSISDEENLLSYITNEKNRKCLKVSPKKGVWNSPFALSSSTSLEEHLLECGVGLYDSFDVTATIQNFNISLKGYKCNIPCSKLPMTIYINISDPNEMIMFGDWQDPYKTYIYTEGKIIWMPLARDK